MRNREIRSFQFQSFSTIFTEVNCIVMLVGKISIGRHGVRYEDNIKEILRNKETNGYALDSSKTYLHAYLLHGTESFLRS
jgi:hypothetical protein